MTRMMRHGLLATALLLVTLPALAQVGVSVSVGEPGFYGQINVGNAPPPRLIYPRPIVVAPVPQYVGAPPIYLRVPPGYQKHWSRHCAAYNACGRPVYFVTDGWYQQRYVPYYRAHVRHGRHGRGRGHGFRHDRHDHR